MEIMDFMYVHMDVDALFQMLLENAQNYYKHIQIILIIKLTIR